MTTRAYYNENDETAARWLRGLIAHGMIAEGDVDERSIEQVTAADVRGYTHCHFFAGIGGWAYALKLAGWPDDRPLWSGSCPCQPFSSAGKGQGFADRRHLWPTWRGLVEECRPSTIVGEQIAAPAGLAWFDHVAADLEGLTYAVGSADLCAAGLGAPHRRQRLYWLATLGDTAGNRQQRRRIAQRADEPRASGFQSDRPGPRRRREGPSGVARGVLDDTAGERREGQRAESADVNARQADQSDPWFDAEWIICPDGITRPIKPGLLPLAHGVPVRVGRLRGYGNAIVPQVAAAFLGAYLDIGPPAIHAIDCDLDEDCTCGAGWDVDEGDDEGEA